VSLPVSTVTPLHGRLRGRRVICCVGSGGVGKTTTSAALALRFAVEGRRALVLTIDPARRLANSLGLAQLGNRETPIDLAPLGARAVTPRGTLHAMMLDLKATWDDLVHREAPSPERAQAILDNRLYQTLSTAMAGSLEYMAMAKVAEVASSGRYDVVVLDTPPTANALDFLKAPDRILDVLDNDAMRVLLGPMLRAGSVGLKLFALPSSLILKTLSRFTGADFLRDLATFMIAFEGMYDAFKARAAQVKSLLAGGESAFVLVTSPNPLAIDEALFFHRALEAEGISTTAVVVNRVQRDPHRYGGSDAPAALREALLAAQIKDAPRLSNFGGEGGPGAEGLLSDRLARTLAEQAMLADLDRREVERLAHTLGPVPLYTVPRLRRDVHDLAGLWQIDLNLEDGEGGVDEKQQI
jgi:anion-transporting  ArsA/GET3 family ATPase